MGDMGEEFEELPPGYKFMPTDVEALKDYLLAKFQGRYISQKIIRDFDIYLCEPQALPGFAKGHKSFYFTPRERKHANGNGNRTSRCIKGGMGFWKMTSKITPIKDENGSLLGRKSTLVYYSKGDAEEGARKTKYLMQEYVLDDSHKDFQTSDKVNNLVLCAIYLRESSKAEKESQARRDFIGQDVVPQQTMKNAIHGNREALLNAYMVENLIWPSSQSSVQPGVYSSRPSTLDEFIATGDHRVDFDDGSVMTYGSGNGICESWPEFQQDQFQSCDVNELNCLVNCYEQLCNS